VLPAEPGGEETGVPLANLTFTTIDVEDREMAEPQSGNEPIGGHPESVDPPWFQELVRRAFEREMRRYQKLGADADESLERAMWYIFDLRNNLTELY
jgi:hypothetical protein